MTGDTCALASDAASCYHPVGKDCTADMDTTCFLKITHLTKLHDSAVALDDISLCVLRHVVHAVVGHDGAGKTTLMKILGGAIPAASYTGEIALDGRPLVLHSLMDGNRAGISIVPRKLALFEHMSVADNVTVATWQREKRFIRLGRDIEDRALELLAEWNIDIDLAAPVRSLSMLQKRQLMIARALGAAPSLIVLDEPLTGISGLNAANQLLAMVRRMPDHGVTCLYLTQRPAEAMQVAERITLLRDGSLLGTWQRPDFDEAAMLRAMPSESPGGGSEKRADDDFGEANRLDPLRAALDRWLRPG